MLPSGHAEHARDRGQDYGVATEWVLHLTAMYVLHSELQFEVL
jgi:hypothetical protein